MEETKEEIITRRTKELNEKWQNQVFEDTNQMVKAYKEERFEDAAKFRDYINEVTDMLADALLTVTGHDIKEDLFKTVDKIREDITKVYDRYKYE